MTKIAKISLDIRKDNIIDNEPIILRQGDSDVIIEASISNDGYLNLGIDFATFVAKKPDGTIISNDPANVSGNVISYPISKHLTESVGKIQDAYFMINNQVTTCGFDISIIPSTQLDDNSVNYLPGLENINKFLKSTEDDWLGRIQQMKAQIDGLNIPDEFKLLMDKALNDAKAQYQPTIDAAEANVESVAADLAAKKLDLTNNSDELNTTITTIKAQVASINSFLDDVQKQIIDANTSFTTGQQAEISQSIADGQKKLADSIASMQSKVTQTVADLKNSSDSAITDMQNNQSNAMAKVDQDITDTKAIMQKLQVSAVGTNLLINTGDDNDIDHPVKILTGDIEVSGTLSRTEEYTQLTAPQFSEMFYRFCSAESNIGMHNLTPGQTYTIQGDVSVSKGDIKFRSQYEPNNNSDWLDYDGGLSDNLASDTSGFTKVKYTFTIPSNATAFFLNWQVYGFDSTTIFRFRRMKLEKGSIATDYSVSPEDILSSGDVQTAISNAVVSKVSKGDVTNENILPYSGYWSDTTGWTLLAGGASDQGLGLINHSFYHNGVDATLYINTSQKAMAAARSSEFTLLPNTAYTFSFLGFATVNSADTNVSLLGRSYTSTSDYDFAHNLFPELKLSYDKISRYTTTFKTGPTETLAYIRLENAGSNDSHSATSYFAELKLEQGDIATHYTRVSSSEISSISQKIEQLETKIDKLSQGKQ